MANNIMRAMDWVFLRTPQWYQDRAHASLGFFLLTAVPVMMLPVLLGLQLIYLVRHG